MKSAVLAASALTLVAAAPAWSQAGGTVRVMIQTKDAGGTVAAALYDGPARFAKSDGAFRTAEGKVEGGRAVVTFEGLPPGNYAVGAFHDVDGNGRLNTLPVGLPTEPYGFSRGARGAFGPPKFADAAFEVRGAAVTQTMRLK